jgi:iron complex outermembrane receptor protein
LINGKRKNLSSLLYVWTAPGRGETGSDLSAIPIDAIKNIEILRDGASAQYGSDAIAGVVNVILKDRYEYSSLTLNSGITAKGDGGQFSLALNSGSNFGDKGFINYTIGLNQQNDAVRSGIIDERTEKAAFGGDPVTDDAITRYLAKYPTANNINGTGNHSASKFEYNLGLPVGDNLEFYSNAGYTFKKSNSRANFRAPYWRIDEGLLHTPIPGAPDFGRYLCSPALRIPARPDCMSFCTVPRIQVVLPVPAAPISTALFPVDAVFINSICAEL